MDISKIITRSMTETTFLSLAKMIINGQTIKALETYYHRNVIVKEADGTVRMGREANIANEEKNLQSVTDVKAELLGYAVNTSTGLVFSKWQYVFTNREGKSFLLLETSVQEWKENLIVNERFYYKDFTSIC